MDSGRLAGFMVALVGVLLHATVAFGQGAVNDVDADGASGVFTRDAPGDAPNAVHSSGLMLIDRSHDQPFDVSGFTDHLEAQGWTIMEEKAGPITISLLMQYDVFMIPLCWTSYTAAEAAAVASFVASGRGLWVLSENLQDPTAVNSVSAQFGVTFNDDRIFDDTDNRGETWWPNIQDLVPDAITSGVGSYGYYAGCCLNVSAPAVVLATADDDARSDACPAGSFPPVLAVYENASGGCAVFSGDASPLHPYLYPELLDAEEELLLQNIVNRLLATGPVVVENRSWGEVKAQYKE